MSEAKHTPGPWRSWVMGSEGCRIMPDTGDKREDLKYIAIVNGRDLTTDQANARLIAAATDLLAVCRRALYPLTEGADSILECHTVGGDPATMDADVRQDYDGLLALISDMKSAVAKVEGRHHDLRRSWRIAQDSAIEREKAHDSDGALAADATCARIEQELGR